MEQQLSSDSNSTIIIKPTSADSDMDTSVPELRRTDKFYCKFIRITPQQISDSCAQSTK